MKKKNIRPLILSSLAALAMAGIGTGATFALFTDKAETTIQVEAGVIDVKSTVSNLKVYELNGAEVTAEAGVFTNSIGGTTKLVDNTLTLEKWVPGDKATFHLENTNLSNVSIKTRFQEKHSSTSAVDLYDGLKITYSNLAFADAGAVNAGNYTSWTKVSPVLDAQGAATESLILSADVTIELPDSHDGQITYGNDNSDNLYQGMNTTITFAQEAVQGNAVTQEGTYYYVSPTGQNYKVDEDGVRTDLTASFLQIVGARETSSGNKKLESGAWTVDKGTALAEPGDTIIVGNGDYEIGGNMVPVPGVTIRGESRSGTRIHITESIRALGDITIENMTIYKYGYYHAIRRDEVGPSDTEKAAYENSFDTFIKVHDVDIVSAYALDAGARRFNLYEKAPAGIYGIYKNARGDLEVTGVNFVGLQVGIGGVRTTMDEVDSSVVINGCTFNHTAEAIGVVGSATANGLVENILQNNTGLKTYEEVAQDTELNYGFVGPVGSDKKYTKGYQTFDTAANRNIKGDGVTPFSYNDWCNIVAVY